MAIGCPAAAKFGLLGLWPNPMHYKGLGKDAFQMLDHVWINFCLSFKLCCYILLFPSPVFFSAEEVDTFLFTLGITGASSVGWCISLAGHAFTRCRLGQDLCDVGIGKSEVNSDTRIQRYDILWIVIYDIRINMWYINKNQEKQTGANMSKMWGNLSPFRLQCAAPTPVCSL